jgi:hypothetical protein
MTPYPCPAIGEIPDPRRASCQGCGCTAPIRRDGTIGKHAVRSHRAARQAVIHWMKRIP